MIFKRSFDSAAAPLRMTEVRNDLVDRGGNPDDRGNGQDKSETYRRRTMPPASVIRI